LGRADRAGRGAGSPIPRRQRRLDRAADRPRRGHRRAATRRHRRAGGGAGRGDAGAGAGRRSRGPGRQFADRRSAGRQKGQPVTERRSFNLSAWALHHRSLVWFLLIVSMIAGTLAYRGLGREEDPSFTVKIMVISAAMPGATTAETLEQVTHRIE